MTDNALATPPSSNPREVIKVIVVGQGLDGIGGIPSAARWLVDQLREDPACEVAVVELATSVRDPNSRRLLSPQTWLKRSLRAADVQDDLIRWGANLPEVEAARYLPRRELTAMLRSAHLVHVVSGGPAIGRACLAAGRPLVLQVATLSAWERVSLKGTRRLLHAINRPLVASFERRAITDAAAVLVMNQQMVSFVRGLGQQRVHLAPPGIDCQRFSPAESGWEARRPLLSVCRLSDGRKGLVRMVRAYEHLISMLGDRAPDLVLAGAGPVPAALEEELGQSPIRSRVQVLTDVDQADLPSLYRTASCFVQTSYEEGLGLSSIEALASGLPVVASATAGSREVVESGVSGWLVEDGDEFEERFATAICSVLENDGARMSLAARVRAVDLFSDEATYAAVRDVYRDAVAGPR